MAEGRAYSIRVELLRAGELSYEFLNRDMYRQGFRQMFKGAAGGWVQLPKGAFFIRTDVDMETVRKLAVKTATAIDRTAVIYAADYFSRAK